MCCTQRLRGKITERSDANAKPKKICALHLSQLPSAKRAALVKLQLPEASARSQSPDGSTESHMLTMMLVWKIDTDAATL